MFLEIFRFELSYRKRRTTTYVYFGIIFLICFLTAASPNQDQTSPVVANAPYQISNIMVLMTLAFSMITSSIMGVSIIRDFDHNTEAILFTTTLRKMDYLMGRFAGSFLVLVLVNCSVWLGLMLGFSIGEYLPWDVAWKENGLLPFRVWTYFQPFLLITISNLFITGALFFMSGALGRSTMIIYTQGIVLLVLYQLGASFIRNVDTQTWAAMLDPFGLQTIQFVTRYWTPLEKNNNLIPMAGVLLYNRLLWIGIGVMCLIITYYGFSFHKLRSLIPARKNKKSKAEIFTDPRLVTIPSVHKMSSAKMHVQQLLQSSFLYARMIIRDIPFLAMIITGILLLIFNAVKMTEIYGSGSYPTAYSVLRVLGSFNLIFIVISIFYSGELVWSERSVRFAPIADALPVPSFTGLLSKFIALLIIYFGLLVALVIVAFLIQFSYNYYEFNFKVYAGTLFSTIFLGFILYTLLSFFIQVLVNNKFLGFTICIILLIANGLLNRLGIERGLWHFASGTLGTFSDMNGYGHFILPFAWFKVYWLAFSLGIFTIAVVFYVRGSETLFRIRWKTGKLRITLPLILFFLAMSSIFLLTGFYIYYNTTILNTYETTAAREEHQAEYEKKFKQYEFLNQPKIVETNLTVNIHPSTRDFDAEGFYYLKNKTNKEQQQIHVQQNRDPQLQIEYLKFDRPVNLLENNSRFRYSIYKLNEPLIPGDSIKMSFKLSFRTEGFEESGSNTDIVYNGTFLNNMYFPTLGYNSNYELTDNKNRKRLGLQIKERKLALNDARGRAFNSFSDDADHMRFEMIVSSEGDQIAIAPGYLQDIGQAENQRYYHYKTNVPISNLYSVVSARYAVKKSDWNNVNLEIYYHKEHEFNIDRMMTAMKQSLDYYTANFSPFQYEQLRIMEFPRYADFAQSFAGTIPFSEGVAFILKADNPDKDVDMAYFVTAHEVAHQWWGHQVMEANVKGGGMLSEGMAQYSALMVMKNHLPIEVVGQYLKYELDNYLVGRSSEKRKENPLYLVEGQNYIQYSKASVIFYALQDYIGESNVNKAFRRYNRRWAFKEASYPTSSDLLVELREVTPDSLQYLIEDMFETITIFENKAVDAVYSKKPNGEYEVTLKVSCEKNRVDSTGVESEIELRDWIDIGIYSGDKVIYLKKHQIKQKENIFRIRVKQEPTQAGIDPINKLIDRHTNDNMVKTTKLIEFSLQIE